MEIMKNDFVLRISAVQMYKEKRIPTSVYRRDVGEDDGYMDTVYKIEKEYSHTLVTVSKLSFDKEEYQKVMEDIKETNKFLYERNSFLGKYHKYNPEIDLPRDWQKEIEFQIEDRLNIKNEMCVVHQGIRGAYPLKTIGNPKFTLINGKPVLADKSEWDEKSKVSEDTFYLVMDALEEMGLSVDDRYIEY